MKKLLGFGVVALTLAGCGGGKVTISSRVGARTPMALRAASGTNQLSLNNGDITVDDVKLIVRRIRLEPTVAAAGQSSSGEDELGIGPFPLHFDSTYLSSATGGLQHEFTVGATTGTYKQIKFEIHKVEPADPATAANATDGALLTEMIGNSVKIHGFYLGKEFTFVSALDEEQEREGTFTVGGNSNIDFNIDPSKWFTDPSTSATLDPTATTNRSAIESNIKASIDTFEDDNQDGIPDTK